MAVDVDHYSGGGAFHGAFGVDNPLLEDKGTCGNRGHGCEYGELFVDECGSVKGDVDIRYNRHGGFVLEVSAHELLEVGQLAHVEKLNVHRIV